MNDIYVSELSVSRHLFSNYHFCRGNSNKRKTRLGVVQKGKGAYIYLGKKLPVCEGDVVFIPEKIYCYSEWRGSPEIEVTYVSCFMHYESFGYEPQIIDCSEDTKQQILQIADLLSKQDRMEHLEAYALFYRLLKIILPRLTPGNPAFDKTLQCAIEYITKHWDQEFSISDLAKKCCVSESTIYHLFKRELGQTPVRFINSIKVNVAIEYLENSNYSIATVSSLTGFHSENHFRKVFFDFTGTTPLRFRKSKAD